jgi:hypothetical protein
MKKIFMNQEDGLTGRTTRLVDSYIQKMFDERGKYVEIRDHFMDGNSNQANQDLTQKIINRMEEEHSVKVSRKLSNNKYELKIE